MTAASRPRFPFRARDRAAGHAPGGRTAVGRLRGAAVLALALVAAGCTSPVPTFDLSAPTGFSAGGGGSGQMVVVVPSALAALNTEKIVVEPTPGQITYLADAQWSDNLPALVQARTIQAFENGSKLKRVARPGDGVNADYQLVTDIRRFGIHVTEAGPEAVVEMSAKLIGNQSGRILAADVFAASVPVPQLNGPGATAALDQASDEVLVKVVRWASARF